MRQRVRLPDGSRSVQSPWVWRGFLFLSLIALGLTLSFIAGHRTGYAAAWGIITLGWFTISMWLWRKHTVHDNAEYERSRSAGSSPPKRPASRPAPTAGGADRANRQGRSR